jgi:beta-galactosidase
MVHHHRNHPCVIIWSIGNENQFGSNFVKSYQWIKEHDRTRPVIYSYPGRVPDSLRIYDLLSIHYPDWKGDIEQYGIRIRGFENANMPVLFDEWAHVACYDKPTLTADPNVRSFWAQSLDSMWTRLFEADGGLGGSIWGMIDETFMLPDTLDGFRDWWGWQEGVLDFEGPCVGYGEWGIIDTWRRKKPEFWGAKKAYSPVKILVKTIGDFMPGRALHLPVHNRFDHTNFSELEIAWTYKGKTGILEKVDLEPHRKGELVLPGMEWEGGSCLDIAFYRGDSMLVDEYSLRLGHRAPVVPVPARGQLSVEEGARRLKISGEGFSLSVDQTTGLITGLTAGGEELIKSGPYLNLKIPGRRFYGSVESIIDLGGQWQCRTFRHEVKRGITTLYTRGSCGNIGVAFTLGLDGQGTLSVDYELDGLPEGKKLQEAGIYFVTGDAFSELSWDREAYFTAYPETDLGGPRGRAELAYRPPMHYREAPGHDWVYDTKGYYYFGPHTQLEYSNLVRSLKEHIYSFTLSTRGGNGIIIYGTGTEACRFDRIDIDNHLIINELWDYPDLLWGNYMKLISLPLRMRGSAIISIQTDQ